MPETVQFGKEYRFSAYQLTIHGILSIYRGSLLA